PDRPLPKAIADSGLLTFLFVSKYVDHLPFYRQRQQFRRNFNWVIHKSTLNGWFASCCTLIHPLYEAQIEAVMNTDYLQADESPIKVQDSRKKGKTHQGYMWVYRNPVTGLVLFEYRKGRGMEGPTERLKGFSGKLQCDGYKVYESLAAKSSHQNLELISCLAHIRRKFFEAKDHHPRLANQALQMIRSLYMLERRYREEDLHAEEIASRRKKEAAPLLNELIDWVNEKQPKNLRKGPIGKALLYAKGQLPKLKPYLEDGRIQIDNNLIENAIRPLALGRKNYLFAGSHMGAQRAAMMYSFFATCKTMDINPFDWLKDTLEKIPSTKMTELENLLPHNYKGQ
ncbi:MAG: IS66 family transposase, partial [Bacteroidetes bacterium]|nr:IS66 family transposase [Bacteroidota bacterium]